MSKNSIHIYLLFIKNKIYNIHFYWWKKYFLIRSQKKEEKKEVAAEYVFKPVFCRPKVVTLIYNIFI